jgi:hypothetical protein
MGLAPSRSGTVQHYARQGTYQTSTHSLTTVAHEAGLPGTTLQCIAAIDFFQHPARAAKKPERNGTTI